MKYRKRYITVDVSFFDDGRLKPCVIHWDDDRCFTIDRVLAVQAAPALKAGGQGDRSTVKINGKETYLIFEHSTSADPPECCGRWFVEEHVI